MAGKTTAKTCNQIKLTTIISYHVAYCNYLIVKLDKKLNYVLFFYMCILVQCTYISGSFYGAVLISCNSKIHTKSSWTATNCLFALLAILMFFPFIFIPVILNTMKCKDFTGFWHSCVSKDNKWKSNKENILNIFLIQWKQQIKLKRMEAYWRELIFRHPNSGSYFKIIAIFSKNLNDSIKQRKFQ